MSVSATAVRTSRPPGWWRFARPGLTTAARTGTQRFRVILLLAGWTIATGAHWDVIQVAAWGRMWARNAQVQPLGLALATTFSPEARCGVCKTVQAAKLDQDGNPLLDHRAAGKAPLIVPALRGTVVAAPVPTVRSIRSESFMPHRWRAAPPVPPPRTFRATT